MNIAETVRTREPRRVHQTVYVGAIWIRAVRAWRWSVSVPLLSRRDGRNGPDAEAGSACSAKARPSKPVSQPASKHTDRHTCKQASVRSNQASNQARERTNDQCAVLCAAQRPPSLVTKPANADRPTDSPYACIHAGLPVSARLPA